MQRFFSNDKTLGGRGGFVDIYLCVRDGCPIKLLLFVWRQSMKRKD
jgi:hypothetical protein